MDCQILADDLITHFFCFGDADCPPGKPFKMSMQIQIMALYALGIFFADDIVG